MKTRTLSDFLTFSFLLAAMQLSCSGPVILSGTDLPPEQRAEVRTGSGVRVHRVDGMDVDGRRFELAPGTHSIELSSKRDVKKVNTLLAGVIDELECRIDLDLLPGEKIFIQVVGMGCERGD